MNAWALFGAGFLLGFVMLGIIWAGLSWASADDPIAEEAEAADDLPPKCSPCEFKQMTQNQLGES